MNKLIILLLGIVIIGCSNQSSELLKNGLTKKASKITEYFINVNNYSSKEESKIDTIAFTEKYYNEFDQITRRIQNNIFDNSTFEIEFKYNNFGKIEKEIIKMSSDNSTFTVDYLYKDSLLVQTYSESQNDIFKFKQIGEYKYNSNDSLVESSTSQVYIDIESSDTTSNSVQINKYFENESVIKSKKINYFNHLENKSSISEYENGRIISSKNYGFDGSLVSTSNYKYDFDKYDNWIKRELFENDTLISIKTREIDYK